MMGIVLLTVILVTGIIFILQNQDTVTLVVLGIYQTPSLSVGLWVLVFITVGFFTGLLLSSTRTTTAKTSGYSQKTKPASRKTQEISSNNSDEIDEWDIEQPPIKPTVTPPLNRGNTPVEEDVFPRNSTFIPKEMPPPSSGKADNPVEVPPPPPGSDDSPPVPPTPRTSAIYSYSYRDSKKNQTGTASDEVVDANYRLITPSSGVENTPSSRNIEEEEEWI